jgi:transposase
LTLGLTGRIWVCVEPVDGRKSFDGLAAVVTTQLGRDPLSGDLFVFKNRRGDRLKIRKRPVSGRVRGRTAGWRRWLEPRRRAASR